MDKPIYLKGDNKMKKIETLARGKEKYIIEVHTIKNLPVSHINADDTGSLKTACFGEGERARISSQCIKNAWRQSETLIEYSNNLSSSEKSYRTRRLKDLVHQYLIDNYGYTGNDIDFADCLVEEIVGKAEGVVCYISTEDVKFIAYIINQKKEKLSETEIAKLTEKWKSKDKSKDKEISESESLKGIFKKGEIKKEFEKYKEDKGFLIPAIVNIFGRMSTAEAIINIESAISTSHAISTHDVVQENDYFIAVDDIAKNDAGGAGHIDDVMFNSSCYYHYLKLSVSQFCENMLKTITDEAYMENAMNHVVETLLEAICFENPKTKQTSFASPTVPECLYVVVKNKNRPTTHINAYTDPVKNDKDVIRNSVKRLSDEIDIIDTAYPMSIVGSYWFAPKYNDLCPKSAKQINTFTELVQKVGDHLK